MTGNLPGILASSVRAVNDDQAARIDGRHPDRVARELRRHDGGLVASRWAFCPVPAPRAGPLFAWAPGDPVPDVGRLAGLARRRGGGTPRRQRVWCATSAAANTLGAGRRLSPRPLEMGHDLQLAEVFIASHVDTSVVTTWRPEELLGLPRRGYHPDAAEVDARGDIVTVIDYLGASYGPDRVMRLHGWCVERNLPYECW